MRPDKRQSEIKHRLVMPVSAMLLVSSFTCLTCPVQAQAIKHETRFVVRISPPQSGVRLLEEVFLRVRSAPQIAMAKSLQQQQTAQNLLKQGDNLAIRPKQQGKIALPPAPSLQLIAAKPQPAAPAAPGGIGGGGGSANLMGATNGTIGPTSEIAAAPAQHLPESWLGNKSFPATGSGAPTRTQGLWENQIAWQKNEQPEAYQMRQRQGVNFYNARREMQLNDELKDYRDAPAEERGITISSKKDYGARTSVAGKMMAQQMQQSRSSADSSAFADSDSNANTYRPPDLGTAVGRLYNLGKTLESVQSGKPLTIQVEEPAKESKSAKMTYGNDEKASNYKLKSAPIAAPRAMRSPAAASMPLDRITAADKFAETDGAASDQETSASYLHEKRRKDTNKLAMSDAGIALLPPNVVTGIPIMRLGIPQSQANNALNSMGSTKQDKVNKWTILSWHRSQANNQTALQLYVRNGLLDAMRIFDPTLIATDFGVSLGDDLARVKEKFGEPAFILPEPGPGAGQNYIYPISQVGFQLSRPSPGEQPRVMSVLIFNVK